MLALPATRSSATGRRWAAPERRPIRTDNPFYDGNGPHWDSVWAYGLRNPYRASYDSATGRLYIGDVGGNTQSTAKEELDLGARAANYGWPDYEGACPAPCTSPLYTYAHNGANAAITGGFVYHGNQFPSSMRGNYFFADYAQHWIKRLVFDANGNVASVNNFEPISGSPTESAGDVVYLTEGPDGALYYVDLAYSDISGTFGVSKIRRIRYLQSNQAPVALGRRTRRLVRRRWTSRSRAPDRWTLRASPSPTRGTLATAHLRRRPTPYTPTRSRVNTWCA
jgi:glucose/arabinose dehydrogenase